MFRVMTSSPNTCLTSHITSHRRIGIVETSPESSAAIVPCYQSNQSAQPVSPRLLHLRLRSVQRYHRLFPKIAHL